MITRPAVPPVAPLESTARSPADAAQSIQLAPRGTQRGTTRANSLIHMGFASDCLCVAGRAGLVWWPCRGHVVA